MLERIQPLESEQEITSGLFKRLNDQFEVAGPDQVLTWGYHLYGSGMVLGTGFGPSGMFLIYRLHRLGIRIPVFYLDTRLLFDETYELRDRVEERFDISITAVTPDLSLEEQAERYGEELWKHNPNRCCYHRKVRPLRAYLSDKSAWITGVRRSQSESRRETQFVEWDPENEVVKLNPLASWTDERVWNYIRAKGLPYNPLHDEGFPSIGCIPCTRPVDGREEDSRSGRWSGSDKTECGIHLPSQNYRKTKQTG